MATNLLNLHIQTIIPTNFSSPFPLTNSHFPSHPFRRRRRHFHLSSVAPSSHHQNPKFSTHFSLSSSIPSPPTSKEEAILQAKTCLSKTLEKPLNNPKISTKLKRVKQPRFRVEIPIIDDSPDSILLLCFQIFQNLPIKRKGSPVKISVLWPNPSLTESAIEVFKPPQTLIDHIDVSSVTDSDIRTLNSSDVAVFFVPERSQLGIIRTLTDKFYPKPVVIFNPRWEFEEESDFGELGGFVVSFEVIYSFIGLEVRGLLSKRKGVIFKCVRNGVLSGESWSVLVEEEEKLKVVSRFKVRPSIGEVETVLYNLMAIQSPITKSAKFLRDLVSNVTGKK